jgi:hypothetical protein
MIHCTYNHSFLLYFVCEPRRRPAHVVVEYCGEEVNAPQFMFRSGDMKLIVYGEQPPFISPATGYVPQLFNISADRERTACTSQWPWRSLT